LRDFLIQYFFHFLFHFVRMARSSRDAVKGAIGGDSDEKRASTPHIGDHEYVDNVDQLCAMLGPILDLLAPAFRKSAEWLIKSPTDAHQSEFLLKFLTEMIVLVDEELSVRIVHKATPNQTLLEEGTTLMRKMRSAQRKARDSTLKLNDLSSPSRKEMASVLDKSMVEHYNLWTGDIIVFQFTERVYQNYFVKMAASSSPTATVSASPSPRAPKTTTTAVTASGDAEAEADTEAKTDEITVDDAPTDASALDSDDAEKRGMEMVKYLYCDYRARGDYFDFDFHNYVFHRYMQVPVSFIPHKPYNINKYLRGRYEIEKRAREKQMEDEKIDESALPPMDGIEHYVNSRMRFDVYMSIDSTVTQLKQRIAHRIGVGQGMIWVWTPSIGYGTSDFTHVMPSISNHEQQIEKYHTYSNVVNAISPHGLTFKFDMELFPELVIALCYPDDTRVIEADRKNWDPVKKCRIVESDKKQRAYYPCFYFFSGDGSPIQTSSIRFRFFSPTNEVPIKTMLRDVVKKGLTSAMYYLKCEEVYNYKIDRIVNEMEGGSGYDGDLSAALTASLMDFHGDSASALAEPATRQTLLAQMYTCVVSTHKRFSSVFDLVETFGAENCFNVQYNWSSYEKKYSSSRTDSLQKGLPFGLYYDNENGIYDVVNGKDVFIRVKYPHEVICEQFDEVIAPATWLSDANKALIAQVRNDYMVVWLRFSHRQYTTSTKYSWIHNIGMRIPIGRNEQFGDTILKRICKLIGRDTTAARKWTWLYSSVYEDVADVYEEAKDALNDPMEIDEFDLPFYAFNKHDAVEEKSEAESGVGVDVVMTSAATPASAATKEVDAKPTADEEAGSEKAGKTEADAPTVEAAETATPLDPIISEPEEAVVDLSHLLPKAMPFGLTMERHAKYFGRYTLGGCLICQVEDKRVFTESDVHASSRALKIRKD
jgi:hypothetical protein